MGQATRGVIRVLLADDDAPVLAALAEMIDAEPGMTVVGAASDTDEAIAIAGRERPDVALLDVKMPGGGGPRAAREIGRVSPATRVVALSAHGDRATVAEMLRAGALSYVVKGAPIGEIAEAVERASRGLASLSGQVAAEVARELDEQLGRRERREAARQQKIEEVRRALEPGAIAPVFQPIVDLETGAIDGYEALARFPIEPQRGPDVWFASAAEVGLGQDLEFAAIRAAVERFDDLPRDAYLSLNVSPTSCLLERLEHSLLGLPAARIVLEVTEHAPVPDHRALRDALSFLTGKGGRLAIDDAGAGFASLRHILRLAPDIIKLDISLTRDIDTDQARRAMAAALVSFGNEMGTVLVAEGIETQAELDTLRALGVRHGQGYFLGRPGELPARRER
jgi:EAL domain-containing protein (putative c-di-GMP-specific phosphodiesterase class I)/FixJ family two-component response regulator